MFSRISNERGQSVIMNKGNNKGETKDRRVRDKKDLDSMDTLFAFLIKDLESFDQPIVNTFNAHSFALAPGESGPQCSKNITDERDIEPAFFPLPSGGPTDVKPLPNNLEARGRHDQFEDIDGDKTHQGTKIKIFLPPPANGNQIYSPSEAVSHICCLMKSLTGRNGNISSSARSYIHMFKVKMVDDELVPVSLTQLNALVNEYGGSDKPNPPM